MRTYLLGLAVIFLLGFFYGIDSAEAEEIKYCCTLHGDECIVVRKSNICPRGYWE